MYISDAHHAECVKRMLFKVNKRFGETVRGDYICPGCGEVFEDHPINEYYFKKKFKKGETNEGI